MSCMRFSLLRVPLLAVLIAVGLAAQATVKPPLVTNEAWTRAFPPFRMVGNLYYVGTYDLASYLITTTDGHILINTGVAGSVPMIRSSIESLGFRSADIKILLATHGHWDHVAGMAEIKRLTGARMLMHEGDVAILEDGGNSDFRFGGNGSSYEPVRVDGRLKDGDKIPLADTEITVHHHPGHTKGASSFTFTTRDEQRSYRVLIVNMGSINQGVRLTGTPSYPSIAQDYARTFAAQKQLPSDVWMASHASQFGLHDKHKPGDAYNPNRYVDPAGYAQRVQRLEQLYLDQLQQERQEK